LSPLWGTFGTPREFNFRTGQAVAFGPLLADSRQLLPNPPGLLIPARSDSRKAGIAVTGKTVPRPCVTSEAYLVRAAFAAAVAEKPARPSHKVANFNAAVLARKPDFVPIKGSENTKSRRQLQFCLEKGGTKSVRSQ
jgi:hypothetical protein